MRLSILFWILIFATACEKTSKDSNSSLLENEVHDTSKKRVSKIKKPNHLLVSDSVVSKYKTLNSYDDKKFYYKYFTVDGDSVKAIYNYLNIDSLKIMGKFVQYSPYDSLISKLGSPDSTKTFDEIGYNLSSYYYPSMDFMMYDYNKLVYCNFVDFSNDSIFLKYDTLEFNSSTVMEDFVRLFPLSALNFEHDRKFNNEIICDWFRFSPKADRQRSDQFIFLFFDKKLRYFIYFDGND